MAALWYTSAHFPAAGKARAIRIGRRFCMVLISGAFMLKIYNSIAREKQDFHPIQLGRIPLLTDVGRAADEELE